jgi:hypothetical protein
MRDGYAPEKAQALFEKLPERLKTAGPVRSIALAAQPPFTSGVEPTPLSAEDSPGSAQILQPVREETVGAGYFATLNVGSSRNRNNEATQTDPRFCPRCSTRAPLADFSKAGTRSASASDDKQSYEVVGVMGNSKDVQGFSKSIIFFLPLTSRNFARPSTGGVSILVRTDAGTDALNAIQNEIAFIDPNLNVFQVQTFETYVNRSRSAWRFSVQTYGGIGVFGLLLAAIGLAGITGCAGAQGDRNPHGAGRK